MDFVTDNESTIRIVVFASVLALMLLLEHLFPKKQRTQSRQTRWLTNLSLVVIDSIALRLLLPVVAMNMAEIATASSWGFFNAMEWPIWLEIMVAVVVLDMLIYWQHVASHHVSFLWAVHKVHHVDRDIDATTGVRFHPVEIILSMLYKLLCVAILGPAVLAVFLFEVLLNASALFNHANLALPRWLDRALRVVLVTPDMHRVHHSIVPSETNSNYGFNLSVWDRLFGSYTSQPSESHTDMVIGIANQQNDNPSSLRWSLIWPLHGFRTGRSKKN